MDWLLTLLENPAVRLALIGVSMLVLSYLGIPLPQSWKQKIYNISVAALQKLLGIQDPGPAPSVSDKAALDSFVVLKERCGGCDAAKKKLQELWVHLEPGVK